MKRLLLWLCCYVACYVVGAVISVVIDLASARPGIPGNEDNGAGVAMVAWLFFCLPLVLLPVSLLPYLLLRRQFV